MSEVKTLFKQGSSMDWLEADHVAVYLEKYYSGFVVNAENTVYVLSWKVTGSPLVGQNSSRRYQTVAEQGRELLSFDSEGDYDAIAIRLAIAKYDELMDIHNKEKPFAGADSPLHLHLKWEHIEKKKKTQ